MSAIGHTLDVHWTLTGNSVTLLSHGPVSVWVGLICDWIVITSTGEVQ